MDTIDNRFLAFWFKRKYQSDTARRVWIHTQKTIEMSDEEIRCYSLNKIRDPLEFIIKDGVSFRDIYAFDLEYSEKNSSRHILKKTITKTNLNLVLKRKLKESDYKSFERAVKIFLSGKYDNYSSVQGWKMNHKKD
jgi:hypothetical protein